jgi:hypothetical protein
VSRQNLAALCKPGVMKGGGGLCQADAPLAPRLVLQDGVGVADLLEGRRLGRPDGLGRMRVLVRVVPQGSLPVGFLPRGGQTDEPGQLLLLLTLSGRRRAETDGDVAEGRVPAEAEGGVEDVLFALAVRKELADWVGLHRW